MARTQMALPGLPATPGDAAETGQVGASLAPGTDLGRYLVISALGAGGMGTVVAAYDKVLDRRIALKLVAPDIGGDADQNRERLLREARAMARVSHPNVLTVHDVGVLDGSVFIAEEYAGGGTIRDWLRAGRHGWSEVLALFVQAGRGLAAAHAAGLIHRDFKPANVLLMDDGSVRVADFGLVSAPGTSTSEVDITRSDEPLLASTGDHALTRTGIVMGTPAYMAPEQREGGPLDGRADQFSYCVSLYEALYGHRPFPGDSPAEMYDSSVRGAIRPAPRDSDVPPWVRAHVVRGLAAEPAERFPSMDALLSALTTPPLWRRRQLLAVGALATALAVAAGAVWSASGNRAAAACTGTDAHVADVWNEPTRVRLRAAFAATGLPYAADTARRVVSALDGYTGDWARMRERACQATHVHGEQSEAILALRNRCLDRHLVQVRTVIDLLGDRPDTRTVDEAVSTVTALPALADCADVAALSGVAPLPADPATRAALLAAETTLDEARALWVAGENARAREIAGPAIAVALRESHPAIEAQALSLRAKMGAQQGEYAGAEADVLRAIERSAAAGDDDAHAEATVQAIDLMLDQARHDEALRLASFARAAIGRAGHPPALRGNLALFVGRALLERGDYDRAREELEAARELHAGRGEAGVDDLVEVTINLGVLEWMVGALARAADHFEHARQHRVRRFGPDHPRVADVLINLSGVHATLGERVQARAEVEEALRIWRGAFRAEHPDVAHAELTLGQLLTSTGELVAAQAHLERALAIYQQVHGPDHVDAAWAHAALGTALFEQQMHAAAARHYRRAYEIRVEHLGVDHATTATTLLHLAETQARLGDRRAALASYETALAAMERALGSDHPNLAYARASHAGVLLTFGDPASAERNARRALAIRAQAVARGDINSDAIVHEATLVLARTREQAGDRAAAIRYAREALAAARTPAQKTAAEALVNRLQ